jgi:hypothetical protein
MAIYARDGFACVWCESTDAPLSLDHLWPPTGGRYDNRSSALVTCCRACNSSRGALRLARWLAVIRAAGADLSAVVTRLRRAVRSAVDIAVGALLLADPELRRRRRQAGAIFRRCDWVEAQAGDAAIPF